MNNTSVLKTPLSEAQKACIDLLKEALAEALEGNITSVGIIACMSGGYAAVMAGTQAADLNLGCDSLKGKILGAVEDQSSRKSKTSLVRMR